jgi:integrase
LGVAPKNKRALVATDLRAMLAATDSGLKGTRDRALLSVAFAGALRRSEVVTLNVSDLEFRTEGVLISIRHAKTDQERAGASVCRPVRHVAGDLPRPARTGMDCNRSADRRTAVRRH